MLRLWGLFLLSIPILWIGGVFIQLATARGSTSAFLWLISLVEILFIASFLAFGSCAITIDNVRTLAAAWTSFLIMINNDAFDFGFVPMNNLVYALAAAVGGTLGGMILLFVAGSKLPETRFFRHVALTDTQNRSEGYVSFQLGEPLIGRKGTAETVLRPSGKVLIDGKMYDAYTRGEYIQKGQTVEVISEEGSSLKVKLVS